MVSIGGITRLTGSGLSITDWAPIMGAIPPLTEEAWQGAFKKYQQIPQYKLINSAIDLGGFKFLYFWEWFHRLIGRLLGFVVLLPGLYFYFRKKFSKELFKKILIGFFLGGLQGALGWFMVKSGLSERTSVSHFRLAAHLSLALMILSYFVWITRSYSLRMKNRVASIDESRTLHLVRPLFKPLVFLLCLQIIYGAFVAGLKAGHAFNTFPLMAGSIIPPNLFEFSPWASNFFENPATVQWTHRMIGWAVLLAFMITGLKLMIQKYPRGPLRRAFTNLSHAVYIQFVLGVCTLLFSVPVTLGVLHQFGAAMIVVFLTLLGHSLKQYLENNAKHLA